MKPERLQDAELDREIGDVEIVKPRWRATSPDQFMAATKRASTPRQLRAAVEGFEQTFRLLSNEDKKAPREAWKRRQRELGIRV